MKTIKITLQVTALIYCLPLLASPNLSPYGVTDGGASHHGAMNLSGNPAAPSSIRWEYDSQSAKNRSFDSGFAFGIARFGAAINYGEVDDIFIEADRIYGELENNDSISNDDLSTLSADTENILLQLEDKGYVNLKAYGAVAPLEIASQKMGGVWSFHPHVNLDINANFSGSSIDCRSSLDAADTFYDCSEYLSGTADGMSNCSKYVLSLADGSDIINDFSDECFDDLLNSDNPDSCEQALIDAIDPTKNAGTDAVEENCNFDLDSDAAVHLKLGLFTGFGLGYSTKAYEFDSGDVFVGLRGKYLRSSLYTTRKTYSEIVNDYDNEVEKMLEDISSDYDSNATEGSGFALDFGLLWTMRYARVGLSVDNFFASEFDYLDENGSSQVYQLPQQTRFEFSLYPEGRWVHLSYVQELEEVESFSGERTQWRNVSFGFTPYLAILHARIGTSEELVSGLSYTTYGLSLLSFLHLDVGISEDTLENDGDEVPRGGYAAVSFEFIF